MEVTHLLIGMLTIAVFRKELTAKLDRLAIWLRAVRPRNRFDHIEHSLQVIEERLRQSEHSRVAGYASVLEQTAVIQAMLKELSTRPPQEAAINPEELLSIKLAVDNVASKLQSPEAEQINATYMSSLAQLAKAADATLQRQERLEKLLEVIITKMNNSI